MGRKRANMKITIQKKNVYGNELIYICDPGQAEIIRGLTGKRTVSNYYLKYLSMLGIEIRDMDQEIKNILEAKQ